MIKKAQDSNIEIIFLAAIATLIFFAFLSYNKIQNLINESKLVNHTSVVKFQLEKTFVALIKTESNRRGYMLTRDSIFFYPLEASVTKINLEIDAIDSLTKDSPLQQQNVIVLRAAINDRLEMLQNNFILWQSSKPTLHSRLKAKALMDDIGKLIDKMKNEEDKLLLTRIAAFDKSASVAPIITIGLITSSIIILILLYFKILRDLKIANSLKSNLEQQTNQLFETNKELAFQNEEKENRATELVIANYARSLIEASLDPLVTISATGKILDVNEASIKVTGIAREKLIGTDFSDYFTEPKKAQEGYRQVFEKGFVADYPLTIKHKNGNLTDVLYNASVYKDDKGNVLGVFAAARDVTDAKEAQEKLQDSEERIRLATTASGVGVWEWNVITNKIRWDAQMFRIYGVAPTADGLVEYSTWSNAVAPEDLAAQEEILQNIVKNIATSNRSFKIYRANDGMQCFIEAIETVRINAVGQTQWVVGTNLDVTEQKQASQYARSLIEASLDPLVTISAIGKILDVNEASIKVTGVAREKLIGTDFSDYFTEPKKAQEGYRQVFEKGFVADYPLTIKHKNGNLTDVLYNASVYKDDKGNVLGVFAAARDVTEQKWAKDLRIANKELAFQNEEKENRAAELVIANKELAFQNEEKENRAAELAIANKELESFNYISSHDLQEPLRKIQIFATRLVADESQNLSYKGNQYVVRMQDAANRMQSLIADLLAYSRTTTTEQKFETTDLNTIIESVKRDFAETIAEKKAIIEADEMCDVHIIPFQFRQLMSNIIGNSLKFSKPDLPPHIIIKSRIIKGSKVNNQKLLSEKEYCHITITDNGIGFAPQYKDHIFELFKRLHDKEKIAGTGIGLTIVKKIVENHKGLITATGELNKGAIFDIYIPTN